jgi:hypothetical protein
MPVGQRRGGMMPRMRRRMFEREFHPAEVATGYSCLIRYFCHGRPHQPACILQGSSVALRIAWVIYFPCCLGALVSAPLAATHADSSTTADKADKAKAHEAPATAVPDTEIEFGFYPSGHMIYFDVNALKQVKEDLSRFYNEPVPRSLPRHTSD